MKIFLNYAFMFFIGCVIGWFIELFYRRFSKANVKRKWINPGFLTGPYLPIYGFGLCALFSLARLEQALHIENQVLSKAVLFILMSAAMTLIELIAGQIFILKMHIKLWDYSDRKYNYKGIICPLFSFFWALLSAVYCFLIDPFVLGALDWLSGHLVFSFVIGFFYGVFVIDVCTTFDLAARIRAFAAENDLVVRYEELKVMLLESAEKQNRRFRFLLVMHSGSSALKEHLLNYLEQQRENIKTDIQRIRNK